MADQMGRETLRRLHADEPVTLTNPNANDAATILAEASSERDLSPQEFANSIAFAQVKATLALAQEVKNLRDAMYGEDPSGT